MVKDPKISVIIPLYNKEDSICATVVSVLEQSFDHFELIIINDGSTDKSLERVSVFRDNRIRIFTKVNEGVSSARNYGIQTSGGEYIFFLDADDIISKDCLSILYNMTFKYSRASIFIGNFCVLIKEKEPYVFCKRDCEGYSFDKYEDLWKKRVFPRTGSMLIRKKCFETVGVFHSDMSYYEDLDMILRLYEKYDIAYNPSIVLYYDRSFSSLSIPPKSFNKDYSFYALINIRDPFYKKIIIADRIYFSFFFRLKEHDYKAIFRLIKRNFIYLPIVVYLFIYYKFYCQ